MTAANTPKQSDSTESGQFSHIKVGQVAQSPADDSDEEVVELGSATAGAHSAAHSRPSQSDDTGSRGNHGRGAGRTSGRTTDDASQMRAEDEADYGVDDLEPMPLTQKIVLFLVIIALIAAGAWIFNYYASGASTASKTSTSATASQTATTAATSQVATTTSQTAAATATSQVATTTSQTTTTTGASQTAASASQTAATVATSQVAASAVASQVATSVS